MTPTPTTEAARQAAESVGGVVLSPDWALVASTGFLVIATIVLAIATFLIWRANADLVRLTKSILGENRELRDQTTRLADATEKFAQSTREYRDISEQTLAELHLQNGLLRDQNDRVYDVFLVATSVLFLDNPRSLAVRIHNYGEQSARHVRVTAHRLFIYSNNTSREVWTEGKLGYRDVVEHTAILSKYDAILDGIDASETVDVQLIEGTPDKKSKDTNGHLTDFTPIPTFVFDQDPELPTPEDGQTIVLIRAESLLGTRATSGPFVLMTDHGA